MKDGGVYVLFLQAALEALVYMTIACFLVWTTKSLPGRGFLCFYSC